MKVYFGTSNSDFKVIENHPSRYGFPAMFFGTTIHLARLYAAFHADKKGVRTGGFVYEFEIKQPLEVRDFNWKLSYSSFFRDTIRELKKESVPSARIIHITDYPDRKYLRPTGSDVVAVFDLNEIESYRLIEENVILK